METPIDHAMRTRMWVVWGTLTLSVFLYLAAGCALRTFGDFPAGNEDFVQTLSMALTAISMGMTGVVLLAGRIFGRLPYTSYLIIRWALSESIAIYGLVLYIMGADLPYMLGFGGWSIVLMILTMPTRSNEDKYFEHHSS